MFLVTGQCFIKKFLFLKTYFIEIDKNVEFLIIVSINLSTTNIIQKIKTAKMKTIDA